MTGHGARCSHRGCRNAPVAGMKDCRVHEGSFTSRHPVPAPLLPGETHPTGGYDDVEERGFYFFYRLGGLRHRDDGPAEVLTNNHGQVVHEAWRRRDVLHRLDGPAAVDYEPDGSISRESYFRDGRRHRDDGPAFSNYRRDGRLGSFAFYLHGEKLTYEEFRTAREALASGAPREWALAYAKGEVS